MGRFELNPLSSADLIKGESFIAAEEVGYILKLRFRSAAKFN